MMIMMMMMVVITDITIAEDPGNTRCAGDATSCPFGLGAPGK